MSQEKQYITMNKTTITTTITALAIYAVMVASLLFISGAEKISGSMFSVFAGGTLIGFLPVLFFFVAIYLQRTDKVTPLDTTEETSALIYVIYKQGQYGQGIHGIHTNLKLVIELSEKAAARDKDDYHSYDVYPIPLGELPNLGTDFMQDYGWMNMDPVHSVLRSKVAGELDVK
jgi:hypothetical protein